MKGSTTRAPRKKVSDDGKWVTHVTECIRWQVKPRYRWLLERVGEPAMAGIDCHASQVVKSRDMRAVTRLECSGPEGVKAFFLKSYRPATVIDRLRRLLRGSPAWREARMAAELQKRQVSVAQVVAIGTRRDGGPLSREDYLLMREIPEAREFDRVVAEWNAGGCSSALSAKALVVAREFAEFVLKLHEAGVYQRDFHAANVLVREADTGRQFYLLDLGKLKVLDYPLPLGLRLSNLAELNKFFTQTLPGRWRMTFVERYVEGVEELGGRLRYILGWLELETWRRCLRLWRKRDRRCTRNNAYFARLRGPSLSGYISRDWTDSELPDLLMHPGALLAGAELIKSGRTATTVSRKLKKGEMEVAVFVKRFNRKKRTAPLRALICGSRARQGWKLSNALVTRGIDTPQPLGMMEKRRFGLCYESFLVTEFIEGAQNLTLWLVNRLEAAPLRQEEKAHLLGLLAGLLRRLHRLGFRQRDLKLSNILVKGSSEDVRKLDFWLIDTDGLRPRTKVSVRGQGRDLARLFISLKQVGVLGDGELTDLVTTYLGEGSFTENELRKLEKHVWKHLRRRQQ